MSLSLFCPCLCFVSSLSSSCLVFVLVLALTCLCHLYLVFVLSLLCLVFVFVLVFVFTSPYSSSSFASFSDFAFALLCCSSCFSCAVDLQLVVNRQLGFVSPFVLSVSFVVFASFLFGCLRSLRTTYYRLRTTHYTLPVPCYLLLVLATYYLQPISYDWRCTSYYCYSYDLILIICYLVAYDRW